MIKEVYPVIREDGTEDRGLILHYSDAGKMMLQVETGAKYGEAIDIYPCPYTYQETDEDIEPAEVAEEIHE